MRDFLKKKSLRNGEKKFLLWRKFKGHPWGITLLPYLNSTEEGNMLRVYYSETGDRAKKLIIS